MYLFWFQSLDSPPPPSIQTSTQIRQTLLLRRRQKKKDFASSASHGGRRKKIDVLFAITKGKFFFFFFFSFSLSAEFPSSLQTIIHSRGTIVELDVCIRTGESVGSCREEHIDPQNHWIDGVEGGKRDTHNARVYTSSIGKDPAGIIIYPSSTTTTETAGFNKISRSIQSRGGEREKKIFQLVKAAGDDYPGTQKFG